MTTMIHPSGRQAAGARPLQVLLVEDREDIARSTADILAMAGHEVYLARDGLAALEVARVQELDVVLLDIGLPGMDGYEVARRLASSCSIRPYLIAITGYGDAESCRRSVAAGPAPARRGWFHPSQCRNGPAAAAQPRHHRRRRE